MHVFFVCLVQVLLDKPIFIGQAVLDLSKLVMYQLRYKSLTNYEKRFGGTITIAGGDTDSFFLEVRNISLKNQLLPAMAKDGFLDCSNYPSNHPLYSNTNKARLGCVKDEGAGEVWREWVLLRPKCYSMVTISDHEHKRAKGIQRSVVAKEMHHNSYMAIYEGAEADYRDVRRFSSNCHAITTIEQRKKALCLWEDKRAWTSLNSSLAFGHYELSFDDPIVTSPSPPPTKRVKFSIQDLL